MDSNAAAKQVSALCETVSQMSRSVSVKTVLREMNIFLLCCFKHDFSSIEHIRKSLNISLIQEDYCKKMTLNCLHFTYLVHRRKGYQGPTRHTWPDRRNSYCKSWRHLRAPTKPSEIFCENSTVERYCYATNTLKKD